MAEPKEELKIIGATIVLLLLLIVWLFRVGGGPGANALTEDGRSGHDR